MTSAVTTPPSRPETEIIGFSVVTLVIMIQIYSNFSELSTIIFGSGPTRISRRSW